MDQERETSRCFSAYQAKFDFEGGQRIAKQEELHLRIAELQQ